MQWVETTGRSIEEAIATALDELGVDQGDAEVEVLDEPRPGLFGKMRGQARVRARVRPTQPRPKQERRERKRGSSAAERRPGSGAGAMNEEAAPANEGDRAEPLVASSAAERGARRPSDSSLPEPDLDAAAARATAFLGGLLEAANVRGTAGASVVDGEVLVDVSGDDLGLFIGPKGQTLLAVQELTRAVVSRRDVGFVKLRLDIAGYWVARRDALGKFANDVAQAVIASGVARVLEPMGSADRKIVHDAVADLDGVVTRSQGEDPHRRVVISPS
jgi:spoIIIJ-associated protein